MSTLSDVQIKNLKIEEINDILKSKKYIPILKKELILKRKAELEKKHFSNNPDDFPSLGGFSEKIPDKKTIWSNKPKKILDNSNVPVVKKPDLLENEMKKKVKVDDSKLNLFEEDFDEDEYYSDEYDYDSD